MFARTEVQLKENFICDVMPIRISDRKMRQLRGKEIPLVKVMWSNEEGEATWELESKIKELYPQLFQG